MDLPLINKSKVVILTHQLVIQYEKDDGKVELLYGDQKIARECQIKALKMGSEYEAEKPITRKEK